MATGQVYCNWYGVWIGGYKEDIVIPRRRSLENVKMELENKYPDQVFDFTLHIDKMEATIGLGLGDEFRGGNTCIGVIDDIGVGVRMPNTMELHIGQEIYVEAKLLEYRSVIKRFEFEHL